MPGYLPFAGALNLPAYTCDNCGFWQRHFETPAACPMCLDARHVVPEDGWRFRSTTEAQEAFPATGRSWSRASGGSGTSRSPASALRPT